MSAPAENAAGHAAGVMPDGNTLGRLRELFDRVVELPVAARPAWLAEHSSGPTEYAALLDLLAADDTDGGILETPAGEVATRLNDDGLQITGLIGQQIGAFRLTRLLGNGGMAAVFLGEREDGQFRQQVAIKLLRRGLYSEVEHRLFLRERQMLASLAHANIARLFDGGVTAAGIPFLVMEYVDGRPIMRHAANARLDIDARLTLFLTVCGAVEAAHRALIVHRDIKPSNILVAGDGTVKLLDFGIAKLLEEDVANATLSAFTPDYAAPEQIRSGPITTATDVYALGVLLHELLLGLRPQGVPPRRPSTLALQEQGAFPAAPPQVLRHALLGDLDNIIVKALAVEPEQRYASASAFAEDIRCHLDGKPVAAHPPSTWYRARKFVARNKGSVATTVAFLLAILAALAAATWQAKVAQREARRANTVRDFVESIFDPINRGTPEKKQPSYADLLASSVKKLDQDAQLAPAERIDLLLLFARLTEKIGEYDKAQALADRASAFADRELGAAHASSAQALAESGLIAQHQGHDEQARTALDAAQQRYARLGIGGPALISLEDGLAALADDRGDGSSEVHYAKLALAARRETFPGDDEKIGVGYNNLGFALDSAGDFDAAADAYRRAYAIHVKTIGADAFETAVPLSSLGVVETLQGHLRQGRADILHAREMYSAATDKPRGAQAANSLYLCIVETTMAVADAVTDCEQALQLSESVYGLDNPSFALAQRISGVLQLERGDFPTARSTLEAALSRLAADATKSWRGRVEVNLGELAALEGRDEAARISLQKGIDDIGAGYPPTIRRHALALLALVCRESPGAACAADTFRRASDEIAATGYAWSAVLLVAHTALARVELDDHDTHAAVARLSEAIEHARPEIDAGSPRLIAAQLWLAIAQARASDCGAAAHTAEVAERAMNAAGVSMHPLLRTVNVELHGESACNLSAQVQPVH